MSAPTRWTDPETSREAAATVNVKRSLLIVAGLLSLGPATDEELIGRAYDRGVVISDSGLRTRRSELVRLGLVEDTGQRATTASGRHSIIWRYVDA